MPSADDLFNQLVAANNRLEAIKGNLLDIEAATDAVKFAVNQVNSTLTTGFGKAGCSSEWAGPSCQSRAPPGWARSSASHFWRGPLTCTLSSRLLK